MLKIKFILLLTSVLFLLNHLEKEMKMLNIQYVNNETEEDKIQIYFNNEELIPPFSKDVFNYRVTSVSTLRPNIIQVGNIKKEVNIGKIKNNLIFPIKINGQKIKLHLYPKEYGSFVMEKNPLLETNNKILITPFDPTCGSPVFKYIISENGDILYYRRSRIKQCASDFKQTKLLNGDKVYSYMIQERPVPPLHYLSGKLIVMDNHFNITNKLMIKETDKHPELYVENHDSLILNKNHYILSAYHETEIFHPETEEPTFVAQTVLQEIKDGKVIFDWVSSDYPHLYTYFKSPDNSRTYNDYMHFNSIIVDPKDNNLIISCAGISSILKINRKTGDIMWTLGGPGDDFKLDEEHHFYGQHSLSFDPEGNLILFDNQSHSFAQRIEKRPKLPHSRILKFKLDEKNKKILNAVSIPLDFQTDTMGSVYQTAEDTYILSMGGHNKVQKIKVVEGKTTKLWELSLDYPTYRAYEIKD